MLTELIVVVDKSGSMAGKVGDVVGGFNTFLKEHKALPDPASLSLVFFDTGYEVIHRRVLVNDVPELTASTYKPGGGTALLDAIGKTMKGIESEQANPDKTIMVIVTDGEENSSKEYSLAAVKEMLTAQEKTGKWETIYLGANVDAFDVATQMGTKMANTANWNASTSDGLAKAWQGATVTSSSYRTGSSSADVDKMNWRPDDADQSTKEKTKKTGG